MEKPPIRIFDETFISSKIQLEKLYQQDRPAILFVKKGHGKISIQINNIELNPNSVVLSESRFFFEIHSLSDDFEGRVIAYTQDYIEKLGLKLNKLKVFKHFKSHINQTAHLPDAEFKVLWSYLDLLAQILDNKTSSMYNDDVLEHLFTAFIYSVSGSLLMQEELDSNSMTRQEEITFEFIKNVFENFKDEKVLQFYADKQQLTIRHLSSVVKSVTQKTANQIISEFVLNEAKILLSTSKEPVYEIATVLKFSDPYSFSHFFKKHEGMSPMQYRTQSD